MLIKSKYTELLIAPTNAFPGGMGAEYVTTDGVAVRVEPHTTWKNDDGSYDDELDKLCQSLYDCSFRFIKSIWVGRLGEVSNYWNCVKLIKI